MDKEADEGEEVKEAEVTGERICVLGAGAWGTTLADLLASKGFNVTLWAREPEVVAFIRSERENREFLPGIRLSESLVAEGDMGAALEGREVVVNVVPSHGVRGVFEKAAGHIDDGALIVSATKGIEEETLFLPSAIIRDVLKREVPVAVLSGPSFAKEVARKLPAAVSVASTSEGDAGRVQRIFSTPYFRVYTNPDPVGVELGGALKNVIALAAGISDGLGLGYNARAALITRGLAEISRLGSALGASPATFSGLSGLGDLVLTCTGPLSRNYSVGRMLGEGRKLREIVSSMNSVAEGVKTTGAARALARSRGVEMPITEVVYGILYREKSPMEAVYELMTRGLKGE